MLWIEVSIFALTEHWEISNLELEGTSTSKSRLESFLVSVSVSISGCQQQQHIFEEEGKVGRLKINFHHFQPKKKDNPIRMNCQKFLINHQISLGDFIEWSNNCHKVFRHIRQSRKRQKDIFKKKSISDSNLNLLSKIYIWWITQI